MLNDANENNDPIIYTCSECNYKTYKKYNYDKHVKTFKHIQNKDNNEIIEKRYKKYKCDTCEKSYKSNNGLWLHKKKCNNKIITQTPLENMDYKELILTLINQNKELQTQIIELSKEKTNIIYENYGNINNKTFNLQLFLNEKCKDALNINEFIDTLNISFNEIERFGTEGYVEGISRIFINGVKKLDIYKRPLHCSDFKREILFLKNENTWEKDNENKEKMKSVIKKIAYKNILRIQDWRNEHPEYKDPESKVSDKYQKILGESMGGYTDEENEKYFDKIIRRVAKEVTIDKSLC